MNKNKWKAALCAALMGVSCIAVLPQTAYAETSTEKHMHQYEFPFNSELYIVKNAEVPIFGLKHIIKNEEFNEYYERNDIKIYERNDIKIECHDIKMTCGMDIDAKGNIIFSFYSAEDFYYNDDKAENVQIELTTPPFDIEYNIPIWYGWVIITDSESANRCFYPPNYQSFCDLTEIARGYKYSFVVDDGGFTYFWDWKAGGTNITKVITSFYWNNPYSGKQSITFKKDDILGTCVYSPLAIVHTDENDKLFVETKSGEKNYFSDIVEIIINGVTFSKEIGNIWEDSEPIVYLEGDTNNDGSFNISDIVMLQKWLLDADNTELSCWQAVDVCKDGEINVFDLCMMKKS